MKEEILKMLRETDGYISGQELCNKFGVSRTAIWKVMKQLKEAGYNIEAQQNKGYHIVSAPDVMDAAELKSIWKPKRNILTVFFSSDVPLCMYITERNICQKEVNKKWKK